MGDHPIIFSAESVQAILAGRKTQTRRVVKPQPPEWATTAGLSAMTPPGQWEFRGGGAAKFIPCPYLPMTETQLWVKEMWAPVTDCGHYNHLHGERAQVLYKADVHTCVDRWKSPLFMPRNLSRLTLKIIRLRAERLHAISEADAIAEGYRSEEVNGVATARTLFRDAWRKLNDNRKGCAWSDNPWVWVVEFRRLP